MGTILQGALTRLPEKCADLPSSCADIWSKIIAPLETGEGLKRLRRTEVVVYQWAIAPQLASHVNTPAATIAQNLVTLLTQTSEPHQKSGSWNNLQAAIWKDCHITIHTQHLIQIEVSDRALATWLQCIVAPYPEMGCIFSGSTNQEHSSLIQWLPEDIFLLQSAHARCCSLLQLGEREKLITLCRKAEAYFSPQIDTPHPLPWLQSDSQLRLCHPVERNLLGLGAEILGDRTVSLQRIKVLCEHFYKFEAACRILGQVKTQDPQLAQARLGLIFFIRCCLSQWLESQGILPLQEI